MNIRQFKQEDTTRIFDMMRPFYDSPAVMNKVPDSVLMKDIEDCIGDCPYVEGYVFEVDDYIAGYSMLAKGYSTEYGGLCIWIEDLYIDPKYRGQGIVQKFFEFLEEIYGDKAVRFRLEVEANNEVALAVYKKSGFKELEYIEMSKEK